ncbi:MAG: hypothetical protein M3P30_08250 [Chloroflexota bacterium]|nr:hypothetical protein [Chloroflexota bacterium]
MTPRETFDDALDSAIDALVSGESVEDVLARHPQRADMLEPLIDTADLAAHDSSAATLPRPIALVHNYAIVRAAVERAQMLPRSVPMPERERAASWFGRRMSFASLTVPAGAVVALVFASMSGAAAASIAVDGDGLASTVAGYVSPYIPLVGSEESTKSDAANPAGEAQPPSASGVAVPAAGSTQASDNRPLLVTVTGTISGSNGNAFVLTNGEGDTHVNIDALTKVKGIIADGATATVSGEITAEKNLHATAVDVALDAGAVAEATATPRAAASGNTPQGTAAHTPTGPPASPTPSPDPEPTAAGASGDHKTPVDPGNNGGTKP